MPQQNGTGREIISLLTFTCIYCCCVLQKMVLFGYSTFNLSKCLCSAVVIRMEHPWRCFQPSTVCSFLATKAALHSFLLVYWMSSHWLLLNKGGDPIKEVIGSFSCKFTGYYYSFSASSFSVNWCPIHEGNTSLETGQRPLGNLQSLGKHLWPQVKEAPKKQIIKTVRHHKSCTCCLLAVAHRAAANFKWWGFGHRIVYLFMNNLITETVTNLQQPHANRVWDTHIFFPHLVTRTSWMWC